jgi:hypothetical protein
MASQTGARKLRRRGINTIGLRQSLIFQSLAGLMGILLFRALSWTESGGDSAAALVQLLEVMEQALRERRTGSTDN